MCRSAIGLLQFSEEGILTRHRCLGERCQVSLKVRMPLGSFVMLQNQSRPASGDPALPSASHKHCDFDLAETMTALKMFQEPPVRTEAAEAGCGPAGPPRGAIF